MNNIVGRALPGELLREVGGKPGEVYRLAVDVQGMGDHQSADIAQETHESILRAKGCLLERVEAVIAQGDELGVRLLLLRLLDSVFFLKAQDETVQSMRIRLHTLLAGKVAVHRSTAFLRALALLASTPCVCVSNDTSASERVRATIRLSPSLPPSRAPRRAAPVASLVLK